LKLVVILPIMLEYRLIPLSRLEGLTNNSKKHSTNHTLASIDFHGFRDPIQVDLVFLDDKYKDWSVDDILADKSIKLTLVEGHDRSLNCLKTLFKKDRNNPPNGVSKDLKGDKVIDWLVPATIAKSDSQAAAIAYSIDHNATTVAALGDQTVFELFDQSLLAAQSSYLLENNVNNLACFDSLDNIYNANQQTSFSDDLNSDLDNNLTDSLDNNLTEIKIVENRSKPGDIWAIGNHRIIVGDCLDLAVWAKLLGDKKTDIIFTSPPYASQRKYDENSGFVPIEPDNYVGWFKSVQQNIKLWLANSGSYFLNIKEHCEQGQRHLYVKKLTIAHVEQWGWCFVDEFCWVRNAAPGSWPNRFKNGFEPVFHFTKSDRAIERFYPERVGHESDYCFDGTNTSKREDESNGTHWNMPPLAKNDFVNGVALPSNVLNIHLVNKSHGHQAAFPHKLPEWFIKAFSDEGDLIVDCFAGSGSTIVAAASTGRVGYGIELSPSYADIAISRIETLISVKAVKID
jgi:site-specific DNA-methyltransferase (adenine-specific)/site-specific DNA-methyltransferase (cytosine-N4-specific)